MNLLQQNKQSNINEVWIPVANQVANLVNTTMSLLSYNASRDKGLFMMTKLLTLLTETSQIA
jgi:hypothetical protein